MRYIASKRHDRCREAIHYVQDLRIRGAEHVHGSSISGNLSHLLFNLDARSDESNHDRRRRMSRHNVGALAAMQKADVDHTFSEHRIVAPVLVLNVCKNLKKIVDCGDTPLGITGVRGPSFYREICHHRTLLGTGKLVLGGFADNRVLRIPLQGVCGLRSRTVGLLSDDE